MSRSLTRAIFFIHCALLYLCFANSLMVKLKFFNGVVIGKQWGIEIIVVPILVFLVISLPFLKHIRIAVVDVAVILFAVWCLVAETFVNGSPFQLPATTLFNILLWVTLYVFVRRSADNPYFVWVAAAIYMATAFAQSTLGLMQLYGFEHSNHGLFKLTGGFHNPGPFSGFVASALPLALGVLCNAGLHRENGDTELHRANTDFNRGVYLKWLNVNIPFISIARYFMLALAGVTTITVLLVLPPAQSRAAWIAGIAGSLFVLANHPTLLSVKNDLKKKFLNIKRSLRFLILTVVLLSIATAGLGLYIMKKGSADGRILIWQVTNQLIKQSPLTGHGSGAFNALYMNEQANWFASGKGSEAQAMVAGSPEAPFNEPLKLWMEKGLIAILLAGVILYFIFVTNSKAVNHKPKNINPELKILRPEPFPILGTSLRYATLNPKLITSFKGALISLLVFSLFSYPFDISSFVLQLVVLVALLAGTSNQAFNITGRKTLFLTLPIAFAIILGCVYFLPQRQEHYQAMKTWQDADQFYSFGSYHTAVKAYEVALPQLQNNGLFLQMYGKALSMDKQHQKSNEILAIAQKHYSSYIIQNTLGDNHKALGNYPEAESAYIKSTHMVPSLLLPKYLLAKLYSESGQHNKAKQTAEEIISSTIKVESSATKEIMNEMKDLVK